MVLFWVWGMEGEGGVHDDDGLTDDLRSSPFCKALPAPSHTRNPHQQHPHHNPTPTGRRVLVESTEGKPMPQCRMPQNPKLK